MTAIIISLIAVTLFEYFFSDDEIAKELSNL